jgi:hypothetical protein
MISIAIAALFVFATKLAVTRQAKLAVEKAIASRPVVDLDSMFPELALDERTVFMKDGFRFDEKMNRYRGPNGKLAKKEVALH